MCKHTPSLAHVHPLRCRLCWHSPSLAYVHSPSAVGYVGNLLHWLTSIPLLFRLCGHSPSLAYVHPPPLSAMWATSFIGLRPPPSAVGYVGNLLHWRTSTPLRCRLIEHTPSLAYVHPPPLSAMWATSFIGLRPPHSAVGYVGTLLHLLTSTPLRCRLIEHTPSLAYVHPTPLSAMWAPSFIGLRPPHSAVG